VHVDHAAAREASGESQMAMKTWLREKLTPYLLSLPERTVRSASALAAGVLREIGEVVLPNTMRRSRLYQNLVEVSLRFMIEQVGQVEGVYPTTDQLSENFLLRRAAGNGIELIGILTFRASPVWVLAALADVSGAGRHLIQEITEALKDEHMLDRDTNFATVDQMLDGLERSAGWLAETINTPPLDVAGLRREWETVRRALAAIPVANLPSGHAVGETWSEMKHLAAVQNRSVFEMSSVMALDAVNTLPEKVRWLSGSARLAAGTAGDVLAGVLLDHYRETLGKIRQTGYLRYGVQQFRPYLYAAALQFSPKRSSLTQRVVSRFTKKAG
jgi:hypothetical protein